MVINGPVAIAGSILYRFKTSGIIVPMIDANTITVSKDILTTMPSLTSPKISAKQKIIEESKRPFSRPISDSLSILLSAPPINLLPLASDCTTIADDCTPTFPPIAVIKGMKKARAGILVIPPSKPDKTRAPKTPPISPMNSQGKRRAEIFQMLASFSRGSEIPVANWKSLSAPSLI